MTPVLAVEALSGGYGALTVFRGANLEADADRVIGILGPNGAGKSTLLKTIAGLLPQHGGAIRLADADLSRLRAHERARRGLVLVPEGRQILAGLTVKENLELPRAAARLAPAQFGRRLDEALTIFPRLSERLRQPGGSLSGGEQQMLSIARALLLEPAVLMLDEPTQGLAPIMVRQVLAALQSLKGRFAIVVVEQNRAFLDSLADHILTMRGGRIEPMQGAQS
ncbi:MAG: ABC transporter ATP-binding protein [Xanthobacteraceae bacterium]